MGDRPQGCGELREVDPEGWGAGLGEREAPIAGCPDPHGSIGFEEDLRGRRGALETDGRSHLTGESGAAGGAEDARGFAGGEGSRAKARGCFGGMGKNQRGLAADGVALRPEGTWGRSEVPELFELVFGAVTAADAIKDKQEIGFVEVEGAAVGEAGVLAGGIEEVALRAA